MVARSDTTLEYAYMTVEQFFDLLPEDVRDDARMALDAYKQAQDNERQRTVCAVMDWMRKAKVVTEFKTANR